MLWLDEVKIRIKNKNQILFTKDSSASGFDYTVSKAESQNHDFMGA